MLRLTIWSALLGLFTSVAVTGSMSERELEVRARELDLRERELDLRERELAAGAPAPATKPLKTFGTGLAGFIANTSAEIPLYNYTLSPTGDVGVMTHFWTTGHTDDSIFRYYIDGEQTASVQFTAPEAAGALFGDTEAKDTKEAAMWGNSQNGKGGKQGGWYINYKIPFGKSIRITIQAAKDATGWKPGQPDFKGGGYLIVRGCENLPVQIGTIALPTAARMQTIRNAPRVFQPLELVPIVDLPSGDGLIYMTAVAANSTDSTYWEGCYHMYTPHDQAFPGTVLSTGMEDFFGAKPCLPCGPPLWLSCLSGISDRPHSGATLLRADSAYGFGGGVYHFPVSGCTHREGVLGKNHAQMAISAYRFHEEDPLAFSGGVKMTWRIGDVQNELTHPHSPKCHIENLNKSRGDHMAAGGCANTTVSSLAWVYTW